MATRPDRVDRWLVFLSGVAGSILFVVAFTVAGLVRPGYSPVHQAISYPIDPNRVRLVGLDVGRTSADVAPATIDGR